MKTIEQAVLSIRYVK